MPKLTDIAEELRNEFDSLKAEFDSSMRGLASIGARLETAGQKLVTFYKQASNEAQPNPEVNATNPPPKT